jgi:hypothetical protein
VHDLREAEHRFGSVLSNGDEGLSCIQAYKYPLHLDTIILSSQSLTLSSLGHDHVPRIELQGLQGEEDGTSMIRSREVQRILLLDEVVQLLHDL